MLFKIVEFPFPDDNGNLFFIELGQEDVYKFLWFTIKCAKWNKFIVQGSVVGFKTMQDATTQVKILFNSQPKEHLFDNLLNPQ